MEEHASPGNTRTSIQAVRNEMNAILASQAAAREAREAAIAAGGGGREVDELTAKFAAAEKAAAARAAAEARPPRAGSAASIILGGAQRKDRDARRALEAAVREAAAAGGPRAALAAALGDGRAAARAKQNTSRLSNLRIRLNNLERVRLNNLERVRLNNLERVNNLEKNKTRKNLRNSTALDYIVISGNIVNVFESEVMKKMAEGYILQGGVSKNGSEYNQALVKHKESRNLLANNANLLVL